MLIGGDAGIGKTALLRTLERDATDQSAIVVTGHCYDLTETPPYGPWSEILSQTSAFAGEPAAPHDDVAGGPVSQLALFTEMLDALAIVAHHRPLVLLLEDLHWADAGSLDLLRFVARGLSSLPILLVVTYRSDEVTRRHPLFPLLPVLIREAEARRIDLRRLEADDMRDLLAERFRLRREDERRLLAYLEERAAGNPFYIGELLRTLEEEGLLHVEADAGTWTLGDLSQAHLPPLLRQIIERRLLRLGAEAHDLLTVAAVIGQRVSLDLWHAVSNAQEETLLGVIEAAVEARLLEAPDDGATVCFTHALIRETLYDGLLPPRRRVWHRRVGEALAKLPDPDPDSFAYHLQQAGDPAALEWLMKAGRRAQASYALLTAAERYDDALRILETQGAPAVERAGLLYRCARMRRYADPRQALICLEDAATLAQEAGATPLAACIRCFRGSLRCVAGDIRAGLIDLEAGIAAIDALTADERVQLQQRLEQLGDPPDEYHYRGALVNWLAIAGRCEEALAVGERAVAVEPPRGTGTSGYANAWLGIATAQATLGRPEEAWHAYERASCAYRAVDHHYQVGNALLLALYQVALPYRADDVAERRRLAQEAADGWLRASGALVDLPARFAWLPVLLVEGAWHEARDLALSVAMADGRATWRPFARLILATLAREQGNLDLAWHVIQEQLPAGPETEPGATILLDTLPLLRLAATLALEAGQPTRARSWLEAHDRWLAWSNATIEVAEGELGWAAYYKAARKLAPARRHAEKALTRAGEPRQPLTLLAAHRQLGEIDIATRRYDNAAAHLEAALDLADACAAPYERALTLLALAELRAALGRTDEAAALLEEAKTLCQPLGAERASALAEALAERLTAPRSAMQSYPGGLTAREVQVLLLVTDGLTDAQVAERLFLSPRTVSQHLRSVYRKLGVSSRAAATRFALENDLS